MYNKYLLILKGEKVIVLFLLFILQACSYTTLDKPAPAINEIKTGEKFTIILPENHKEFFMWKFNEQHNTSVIEYIGAVWHGNEKGVYYNFKALKSGLDTLHLTQLKLKDTTRKETFIIKVTE